MGKVRKNPMTVVPKKTKSLVWRYFGDNLDGVHSHCILCKEKSKTISIKINDGSTKPLWSHLASFHKSEWKDIEMEEVRKEKEKDDNVNRATLLKVFSVWEM